MTDAFNVTTMDNVTAEQLRTFHANAEASCRQLNTFRHRVRILRNELVLRENDPDPAQSDADIRMQLEQLIRAWGPLAQSLGCFIGRSLPGDRGVERRIHI